MGLQLAAASRPKRETRQLAGAEVDGSISYGAGAPLPINQSFWTFAGDERLWLYNVDANVASLDALGMR